MQNHRRIGRMTLWVLLLGPLCLAIHAPTARAGAIADSDLLDVRFTFLLANATELVRPGPPVVFCLPIGNGSCGELGIDTNLTLFPTFGPTNPTFPLFITLFGSASANSPPAVFSSYIDGVTAFFDFSNLGLFPVNIQLTWNAAYKLSATGAISFAATTAFYMETDDNTGQVLVPNTLLFRGLQRNNGNKTGNPKGNLVVKILPLSTTVLRLEDYQIAFAANAAPIDEPPAMAVLVAGLVPLLGCRVRRRLGRPGGA